MINLTKGNLYSINTKGHTMTLVEKFNNLNLLSYDVSDKTKKHFLILRAEHFSTTRTFLYLGPMIAVNKISEHMFDTLTESGHVFLLENKFYATSNYKLKKFNISLLC